MFECYITKTFCFAATLQQLQYKLNVPQLSYVPYKFWPVARTNYYLLKISYCIAMARLQAHAYLCYEVALCAKLWNLLKTEQNSTHIYLTS